MDQKATVNVLRERDAIQQLRDFYQNITDTQLGSFWEDFIEEIVISNQKSIMKMRKNGEYISPDWFDNSSLYKNIRKIVDIEGGTQDVVNLNDFMELYEKICEEEREEYR